MEGPAFGGVKRKLPFTTKSIPTGSLEPPVKKKFVPISALKPAYDQRCTRSSSSSSKKVTFNCPDSPESSPKTRRILRRSTMQPIRFPLAPPDESAKKEIFKFGANPLSSEKKKLLMQPVRFIENDLLRPPATSPFTHVSGNLQRRSTFQPVKFWLTSAEGSGKKGSNLTERQLSSGKRKLPQPVRLIDSGKKRLTNVVAQQRKSIAQPKKVLFPDPEVNSKPAARKCLWSAEKAGKTIIPQTRGSLAPEPIKRRKTAIGLQEAKVLKIPKRRLSTIKQKIPEKINVGNQTTCDMGTQTDEIAVTNESSPNGSLLMFEKMENLTSTPKQIKGPKNSVIQNIIKRLDAIEKVLFDKENPENNTPVAKKDLRKAALINLTTKNSQQTTPLQVREGTIKTYRDVVSSLRFLETPSALIGANTRSTHKEHNLSRNILRQMNDL